MTTRFDQPTNDTSRHDDIGAAVAALRSQLTGRAPPPAASEGRDRWFAWPMIKPSTHQRVAIAVHRQDRL